MGHAENVIRVVQPRTSGDRPEHVGRAIQICSSLWTPNERGVRPRDRTSSVSNREGGYRENCRRHSRCARLRRYPNSSYLFAFHADLQFEQFSVRAGDLVFNKGPQTALLVAVFYHRGCRRLSHGYSLSRRCCYWHSLRLSLVSAPR